MPDRAQTVSPTLREFMEQIVDYAGMFPPAKLPLPEAFQNYLRYRGDAEAWMLGRFVVPAARLGELIEPVRRLKGDSPVPFSVLGSGGDDAAIFPTSDLEAMASFTEATEGGAEVHVMETRIPPTAVAVGGDELRALAQRLQTAADRADLDVFLELPIDPVFRRRLPALLETIAELERLGVKLRTGGVEPDAFPAAGELAFALTTCRRAGVRFKATAGLHHPIRRFDASVGTRMHGFVNLFGAAILGAEHDLDAQALTHILLDEQADHFRFTDAGFAWKEFIAPPASVRHARRHYAVSFGSCSFDQPKEEILSF